MAIVLVVGLMPLPAPSARAYADDASLTVGASQLFTESEAARTGAQVLQAAEPEELETQAAGSIVFSAKNFTFNLYPGYSGCLKAITVKNNGAVKVTDIKLSSFTARTTTVVVDDESGATRQDTIPYVYTNEYGTVRYDSCYLEYLDSWADDEKFELAPGASRTLYFTVASPFRAGYTLPTGTDVTDTVKISSSAGEGTLTFRCRVYDPENVYAKVGTVYTPGSISGAASLNFGTVAAGTPLQDDNRNFNNSKDIFFQNMSTAPDPKSGAYPNITVDSVTIEGEDAGVFQDATPGLYSSRMTIGQGAWYERTIAVDATYVPAGTYTATLCYHISPYKVDSNAGNTTDGVIRVPMTVKVTGTNPNIPVAVTGLTATPGNGYVGLSWNKTTDSTNTSGYVIWRTDHFDEVGNLDPVGGVFDLDETTYVDRSVVNGTTYTYYVTPRFGGLDKFAKKSNYVSATPLATAEGKPLAPSLNDAERLVGGVRLKWTLDKESQLQFDKGDGKGMADNPIKYPAVDHFNIYKDGSLVATYSQNAYVAAGWDMYVFPDGYMESRTVYQWVYDLPTNDYYQWHKYRVSAVTKSGAESYLSNDYETDAGSDVPITSRLDASWTAGSGVTLTFGWDTETWIEYVGYGITYTIERKEGDGAWQTVRTAVPEDDGNVDSWTDTSAAAGKTYTYRVTGTNSAGKGIAREATIKTSGNSSILPDYGYEEWLVTEGTLTADVNVWGEDNVQTVVKLYRKEKKADETEETKMVASKTVTGYERVILTDTPANGEYTYWLEFTTSGGVRTSSTFAWTRNENVSSDDMLKPPGKVTGVAVKPGDRKLQFTWDSLKATATTGAPSSYQICEYMVYEDGDIGMYSSSAFSVPAPENSFVVETDHNGSLLNNNSTYRFMIRAVNAAGVSDWTDIGACTPNGDDWSTAPPAAPVIDEANTKIQQNDDGWWVLHVEWMPGEEGGEVSGYHVRVEGPLGGSHGTRNESDELSWDYSLGTDDASQITKGTYSVRVAAYNSRAPLVDGYGNGGVEDTFSYTYGVASAAPWKPVVRDDRATDSDFIRLTLTPDYDDPNKQFVTSYDVWRSTTNGDDFVKVATVAANGSSTVYYDDYDITNYEYRIPDSSNYHSPNTYYYKVYAYAGDKVSEVTTWTSRSPFISNASRDAARQVNTDIGNLPNPTDAEAVAAAVDEIARVQQAYEALADSARVTFVTAENASKLEACVAAAATVADKAAALRVEQMVSVLGAAVDIAALTVQAQVDSKDATIVNARVAYDALTDAQRALLTDGVATLTALETAESAIEVAQVRTLIAGIPADGAEGHWTVDSLEGDRNKVVNARAAYDGLTVNQKAQVDSFATLNNNTIKAAEAKIADIEALAEVKALIDALPAAADITRATRAAVADQVATARCSFDALTADQKAAVGDITKLTDAEAKLAELEVQVKAEAKSVQDLVDALDPSDVASGTTSVSDAITKVNTINIRYGVLADDAKGYVDLTKLASYETAIKQKQKSDFDAEISAATVTGDSPIATGGLAQYAATALPNTTVSWASDTPSVAVVDAETGEVSGVANGTAVIIATYKRAGYGGTTLQASTFKQVAVCNVSLAGPDQVVFGGELALVLTSSLEGEYTWESSNSQVISVDSSGATTVNSVGMATITARNSSYPTVVVRKTVHVVPAPITVTLSQMQFTYNGASQRPAVSVRWAGGTVPIGGYRIEWPVDTANVGAKIVRVRGLGNFTDGSATYRINPQPSRKMHRLYNPWSGEHFYTGDANEKNHLVSLGWNYEGVGWNAPTSGKDVHRLYNPYTGEHHFTLDAAEKNACVAAGWRYEGVGWKSGGSVRVYREYNPYAPAFYHNYTRDAKEHSYLCSIGWVDEGTGWYGV